MNLHEYQGKQLFAEYGLPVSKGYAVDTLELQQKLATKSAVPSGLLKPRFTQVVAVKRAASSWFAAKKTPRHSLAVVGQASGDLPD